MKKLKRKDRVPRYQAVIFLIFPFILYLFFNLTFASTIFIKEIITYGTEIIPALEEFINTEHLIPPAVTGDKIDMSTVFNPEERVKNVFTMAYSNALWGIFFAILLFNIPFKIFFFKKGRGKEPTGFTATYTKTLLNFSPEIIALLVLLGSVYIHYTFFNLYTSIPDDGYLREAILNLTIISLFTTLMILVQVYIGQKYRVQNKYIEHVFDQKRLYKKPKGFNFPGLRGRFFLTTIIQTFIPLGIVLFYVITSIKTVDLATKLPEAQFNLLFGDLIDLIKAFTDEDPRVLLEIDSQYPTAAYIDSFGLMQMIFGVVPGLFFSLIYILRMVSWNNATILKPVYELQKAMKQVTKGNLNSYVPVRSREETGQLSAGFNLMLNGLKDRERIKSLFGQYLSAEISEEIIKGNIDLDGSIYQATILFADIRGFTTISESISPHETITFLNEYYNVLIDVIQKHGGIIDKFMGDGILVLFGVPIASQDHADRAVAASLEICQRLEEFNKEREKEGKFAVRIGIGIHTGEVVAGNVGNSDKLEYTVIGDTVNIASRIEGLTKKFETPLLIGEAVYKSLSRQSKDRSMFKKVDGVALRGKREKINLLKLS